MATFVWKIITMNFQKYPNLVTLFVRWKARKNNFFRNLDNYFCGSSQIDTESAYGVAS